MIDSDSTITDARQENAILLLLAAVQFTHILDFMIMMPLGPQFMRVLHIDAQAFSWLISSYSYSAGVTGLLAPLFIDRMGRKHLFCIMYAGFILGTLSCGFANSYESLLMARIFTGGFGGILGALIFSIVGDLIPFQRRGRAMGIVMAGFSASAVVGVPLGLFLATHWNYRVPFFVLAGLASIVYVGIVWLVPAFKGHIEINKPKAHFLRVYYEILKIPEVQVALVLMFILVLGQFSVIPFISAYYVSNVGFSERQLSFIYLFGGLMTAFTSPWAGRLADKFGKKRVFRCMAVASIIPLVLVTHLPPVHIGVALLVTTLFFAFVAGRMVPAMALITECVPARIRGGFMSIHTAIQNTAAAVASTIAGLLVTTGADRQLHGYPRVGYLAVLATLFSLYLIGRLDLKIKARHEPE
ncbi:MAG: MFS transporter [Verrucomicrobiota bacterium]|nr:MFS transporter [Verrucomicrobiota bacterium]